MNNVKNFPSSIIAGVLFLVLALNPIIQGYPLSTDDSGLNPFWPFAAAYVFVGIVLIIKKKDILLAVSSGILAVAAIYLFYKLATFGLFNINNYHSYYGYYGSYKTEGFNFFCMLPFLLTMVAYIAAFVYVLLTTTDAMKEKKESIKKLWFIPGACMGISMVLGIIIVLASGNALDLYDGTWSGGFLYFGFLPIVFNIIATVALLGLGLFVYIPGNSGNLGDANFYRASQVNGAQQTNSQQVNGEQVYYAPGPQPKEAGYFDMALHVILLLFTCGIWQFIWIYRVTEYLNRDVEGEYRNPVTKLLLCMFIPFYYIYWTYKSCERIDNLARKEGIPSDITTMCLVLAIFVAIVPPIIMQDKLNAVSGGKPQRPNPTPNASNGANFDPMTGEPIAPAQPAPNPSNGANFDPMTGEPIAPVQSTQEVQQEATQTDAKANEDESVEELRKFKSLLDEGVITQEDFEEKKKQLLGL